MKKKNEGLTNCYAVIGSWSNFSVDWIYGNTFDFGDFDRCLSIHHSLGDGSFISGQHCMVHFVTSSNKTIRQKLSKSVYNQGWKHLDIGFGGAVCIPSSCPSTIVESLMEQIFQGTDLVLAKDYDQSGYCKVESSRRVVSNYYLALLYIATTLVTLAVIGTFYDIKTRNQKTGDRHELFLAFSVYSNGKQLFSVQETDTKSAVNSLRGIRALSTFTIIFYHIYYHRAVYPVDDPQAVTMWSETFWGLVTFGLKLAVELFFLMSGLLVTKSILRSLET